MKAVSEERASDPHFNGSESPQGSVKPQKNYLVAGVEVTRVLIDMGAQLGEHNRKIFVQLATVLRCCDFIGSNRGS